VSYFYFFLLPFYFLPPYCRAFIFWRGKKCACTHGEPAAELEQMHHQDDDYDNQRLYYGEPRCGFRFLRSCLHITAYVVTFGMCFFAVAVLVATVQTLVWLGIDFELRSALMFSIYADAVAAGLGLAFILRANAASRTSQRDIGRIVEETSGLRYWARTWSPFRIVDDGDEYDDEPYEDPKAPSTAAILQALGLIEAWRAAWLGRWILSNSGERRDAEAVDRIANEVSTAATCRARELGQDPFGLGLSGPDWNGEIVARSPNKKRKSR